MAIKVKDNVSGEICEARKWDGTAEALEDINRFLFSPAHLIGRQHGDLILFDVEIGSGVLTGQVNLGQWCIMRGKEILLRDQQDFAFRFSKVEG